MLEGVIEKKAREYAITRGWFVRKVQWIGMRGAPDRMFARGGLIVFIEFKKTGGKPRLQQEREIARMRKAGIWVLVFDNLDEARAFLL